MYKIGHGNLPPLMKLTKLNVGEVVINLNAIRYIEEGSKLSTKIHVDDGEPIVVVNSFDNIWKLLMQYYDTKEL